MSAPTPITVVAHWHTSEERVAEVLALAEALRPQSLAEPGCLSYEVFRSVYKTGTLLLIERYKDSAAIEEHRNSRHYRELVVDRIVPLLTSRQVELLHA